MYFKNIIGRKFMKRKNYDIVQNSKEMLDILYSQRYYYNKANKIEIIAIVIMISIGILNFFDFEQPLTKLFMNFILMFINSILFNQIKTCTNRGASLKELFDNKLFVINTNNKNLDKLCKEYIYDVFKKNNKNYYSQIESDVQGNLPGLKNWYEICENKNEIDSILYMQKQNLYWDESLSKKYNLFLNASCLFVFCMFILFAIISDYNPIEMLAGMIYLKTIVEYRYEKHKSYVLINNNMIKCITIMERADSFDDVIEIQKMINLRRNENFNPPNILHKIFAKEMHEKVKIKIDE